MNRHALGSTGLVVPALGLGLLAATVLEIGTCDYYGARHNELLIGEALRGRDREDARRAREAVAGDRILDSCA